MKLRDPDPVWPGTHPYEALEPAGIGPESTQDEVEKASFTLMTRRMMNPVTQAAWKELRDLPRRLVLDALLYDVDLDAALAAARARLDRDREAAAAPPEDPAAFELGPDLLAGLADDLPPIEVRPAPPVDVTGATAAFPSPALLDALIRFDQ